MNLDYTRVTIIITSAKSFKKQDSWGPCNIPPPPARFPTPQDLEIQNDVIIIMYTMDIVQ